MTQDLSNMPTGTYIKDYIIDIAEAHFPDAFNVIPDVEQLPWEKEDQDRIGFNENSLFLGRIIVDGISCKVSAYMTTTGEVQFFRGSVGLTRNEYKDILLCYPWEPLREEAKREDMRRLKALCGYYFVAAGYTEGVRAKKKNWFVSLELACRGVGGGLDALAPGVVAAAVRGGLGEVGESQDGDVEDNGESGGDSDDAEEDGMDVEVTARIVQELLGMARHENPDWTEHAERELESAWPGRKKYWE